MKTKVRPSEKFCPGCEKTLSIDNFYFYAKLSRYDSQCADCNRVRRRESKRARYTPEIGRRINLRDHYKGFSHEQYEEMFVAQNGACAICGHKETAIDKRTGLIKNLHVDHCHATNRVRALLCQECNIALGQMHDSPERIRLLLAYAEKWVR